MCKTDYAYINEKVARGQVRIFNLSKKILLKFRIVINCKMLSNHFSNNINYKARPVLLKKSKRRFWHTANFLLLMSLPEIMSLWLTS